MPAEVKISFRGMDTSPSVEAQIQRRAEELERFSDRLSACRVVVEAAHRRHRQGTIYHVSVDLAVPGGRVVVNREPGEDHAHVAIRDAFDAARRRLQDHMRRLDGQTKVHAPPLIGRIIGVFAERNYAFLETDEGQELYVHRNAVADGGFDRLKVGDRVRYSVDPKEGEKGAQASVVIPLGAM